MSVTADTPFYADTDQRLSFANGNRNHGHIVIRMNVYGVDVRFRFQSRTSSTPFGFCRFF